MRIFIRKCEILFVVSMLFFSFLGCSMEDTAENKEAVEGSTPKGGKTDTEGSNSKEKGGTEGSTASDNGFGQNTDKNKLTLGNTTLTILKGDITKVKVDAIVNSANEALKDGEGVNGAIGNAAGQVIYAECAEILKKRNILSLPTGEAVITSAGKLTEKTGVKYIIHTPGPRWKGGKSGEAKLLAASYTNSLDLAQQNKCETVAFPSISTEFGYPLEEAADIAVSSVIGVVFRAIGVEKEKYMPKEIIFVLFGDKEVEAYQAVFAKIKDMNKLIIGNTTLTILRGDITKVKVDAIVNAANEALTGGEGVNGAIGNAAGQVIYAECAEILKKRDISSLPTGEAVITSAGKLTEKTGVKYIIHTPGPIWKKGDSKQAKLLAASYTNSLDLAQQNKCETVAFPSISIGIFHYPLGEAVDIAVSSVIGVIEKGKYKPKEIIFVLLDTSDKDNENKIIKAYQAAFAYQAVFAKIKDKK